MNATMPSDILLAVTFRCNARCQMCSVWSLPEFPDLPAEEYKKLPTSAGISVTGGEPFLRDDLADIVALLAEANPKRRITINTNGFPNGILPRLKTILTVKPDIAVVVAIDGIGDVHDHIRGVNGAFAKDVALVKKMRELGVRHLRVSFTAGDHNIEQLMPVYALAKDLGAEFSLTLAYNAETRYGPTTNVILNVEALRRNIGALIAAELRRSSPKSWLRAYFAFGLLRFAETGARILPKGPPAESVFIHPNGTVYINLVTGLALGRLQDFDSFDALMRSEPAQRAIAEAKGLDTTWHMYNVRPVMRRRPITVLSWVLRQKVATTVAGVGRIDLRAETAKH